MTSISLRKGSPDKVGSDVLVIGALHTDKAPVVAAGGEQVAAAFGRRLTPLLTTLGFRGKAGECVSIPVAPGTASGLRAPLVLVVGLGAEVTPDAVRRAAGVAARALHNAQTCTFSFPSDSPELVAATVEGFRLGAYRFHRFKTETPPDTVAQVFVLTDGARQKDYTDAFARAEAVAEAVVRTRDWVNTPPGDLRPAQFVDAVSAVHKEHRKGRRTGPVSIRVWDESDLEAAGCGGILGVGKGSSGGPRMVRLTYKPQGATRHLALVGKGITFDSGGLSIKPAASMVTMKMDMAGAAVVVNTIFAIAELGLPVQITAFAPLAENMISGNALRPGDVLTMYRGRTVEVTNTDAEGRLILADALGFAVEAKPDLIVDVATLTGACMVALGDRVTGVFGDDDTVARVASAAEVSGERVWHMPIPDEMTEKVRSHSKIADLAQHTAERWGGASYAAAFLREFVDGLPWAHLDIAGPAFNEKTAYGHVTAGGTGVGVATLVALAEGLAAE